MLTTLLTATLFLAPCSVEFAPAAPAVVAAAEPQVTLTFARQFHGAPYTGRVYFVMVKGEGHNPRQQMTDWFNPPQIFSLDVADVKQGTAIDLSKPAHSFPKSMADLPAGRYTVQGVARRTLDHYAAGQGMIDLYSEPTEIEWPPAAPLAITLDKMVGAKRFPESKTLKLFTMKSELLSKFHGRDVQIRAGVSLPEGWSEDSTNTWPAVYFIGGFGGNHRDAQMFSRGGEGSAMRQVITIAPDPTNYWGHCVFADSANTGPWGRALTEELIPAIEKQFHGPAGAPAASATDPASRRFVTGISSGGWSSLWLQVTYPDMFAGCWSHSPDPVDFRDFQQIDLYAANNNMYTDAKGQPRPVARADGRNILFYKEFVAMESALGPGGQIQSFEAVFSPRDAHGFPRSLFDRTTGAIDTETAKAWQPYDINLVLKNNWKTLAPKLAGKLHIYGGSDDNFFLDGAVEKLAATLKELDPENTAKAEVKIIKGMGHDIHYPAQNAMFKAAATTAPKAAKAPAEEPALLK